MESLTIKASGDIFNLIISNVAASVLTSAFYTADETSLLAQLMHWLASAYLTSINKGFLGMFYGKVYFVESAWGNQTSYKLHKEQHMSSITKHNFNQSVNEVSILKKKFHW